MKHPFAIPPAPNAIMKGVPLKDVLSKPAATQLATNLHHVYPKLDKGTFIREIMKDLEPLTLVQRGDHMASVMRNHLPTHYEEALDLIIQTLTPPLKRTEDNGLAPMFYMPHCSYIAKYGIDPGNNNDKDPFEASFSAMYELTQRFTCEFPIRYFIVADLPRVFDKLNGWLNDPNPHVRRLCSEGTRSRLPWDIRLKALVADPSPCIPLLEHLKNDESLYVRRSVANHIGDIAKDHLDLALDLCRSWLPGASKELKWVIRHALRHPSKKGNEKALALRAEAK